MSSEKKSYKEYHLAKENYNEPVQLNSSLSSIVQLVTFVDEKSEIYSN